MNYNLVESDYVQTPEWCALDMINWFKPSGTILDPCRGENKVFYNLLDHARNNIDYCEIKETIDFFENNNHYNWIIGNPPYSIFQPWMRHSYEIADNILYLLPTFKIFNALGLVRMYKKQGWIRQIRVYDVGRKIEWSRSRPIVAAWFQKDYHVENTVWSWYK